MSECDHAITLNGIEYSLCNQYVVDCPYCEIEKLDARIAKIENPGWCEYIELTQKWLEKYPPDIFTGVSGDRGQVFVVAIRKALAALQQENE